MLQSLQAKRVEYEEYLIKANAALEFNSALIVPSIFDVIFSGKKAADPKAMPTRPTAYTGDTFVATGSTAATT